MAKQLTPDSLDLASSRSLLVLKPSSLGDIVHTLPAVALIKRAYPKLSIRWVVRSDFMAMLESNPDLDGVVEFPRSKMRGLSGVAKLWSWSKSALRQPAVPDVVIDFQGLARSAVMAWRSGACERIGISDAREGARFSHHWRVEVDADAHAVERYLAVPRALGIDCDDATELFRLPAGELPEGLRLPAEPFVMLHPFSAGKDKSLTPDQVAELCDHLAPVPVCVVGRTDLELPTLRSGAIDLLNQTSIPELIAVTRRAGFVVSVDSGPMHIAAAISDRLISIHTWSDPRKVGPYAPEAWVWKGGKMQQQKAFDAGIAAERSLASSDLEEIATKAKELMNR